MWYQADPPASDVGVDGDETWWFRLPGLPLIPVVEGHVPTPYQEYVDTEFGTTLTPDGGVYSFSAYLRDRRTQLEYHFESNRAGEDRGPDASPRYRYSTPTDWSGEALPLKEVKRHQVDDSYTTILTATQTTVDGRIVPDTWTAQDGRSVTFHYDLAGVLTSISGSDQQNLEVEIADVDEPYTVMPNLGDPTTTLSLTKTYSTLACAGGSCQSGSSCSSCPTYHYDYAGGKVKAIKDTAGNVLLGADYDRGRVTEIYRQRAGAQSVREPVYRAVWDAGGMNVTHYRYVDGQTAQVVIEGYEDRDIDPTPTNAVTRRLLTSRTEFSDLNPVIGVSVADVTNYIYEYVCSFGDCRLNTRTTQFPRTDPLGNRLELREDLQDDPGGGGPGTVSKETLAFDGLPSLTRGEYSYSTRNGRLVPTVIRDQRGGTTQYWYNNHGDVTMVLGPSVTNVETPQSPFQLETTYEYDVNYRNTRKVEKKSGTQSSTTIATQYEYDFAGNMTKMIEDDGGLNLTSSYSYDSGNRLTKSVDPRGVTREKRYTRNGSLTREYTVELGDPNPDALDMTLYEYDADGRLSRRCIATSRQPISNPETNPGSCTACGSGCVSTVYEYDAFGRQTQTIEDPGGLNLVTTVEYDNQDRVTKSTAPDGTYSRVVFDGRGRKRHEMIGYALGGAASELTTSYEYDANNNLTLVVHPDGLRDEYEYDMFDRRTKHKVTRLSP